jgi:hypothetical protein
MIYGLPRVWKKRGLSEEEKTRKAMVINDLERTNSFGGSEARIKGIVVKRG